MGRRPVSDAIVAFVQQQLGGSEPLYVQVREAIESYIEEDDLSHGTQLPVERSLAEALGVSRITVRKAYEGLERRGVAARRRGAGTFVVRTRVQGNLRLLSGFTDEVDSGEPDGLEASVRTRVLELGYHAPTAAVRRELEVGGDAMSTIRLVRVRYIGDVPSTYEVSWMPAAIGAPLLGVDMTDRSLFRLLVGEHGLALDHATETLRATALDQFEAEHLECEAGTPVFAVNRTTFDADGRPVEYAETLLRGDRFYYATTLHAADQLLADPGQVSTALSRENG